MQTIALNNIACRSVILPVDAWLQEMTREGTPGPKATQINPIAPSVQHTTPFPSRLSTGQQTHDTLSATTFVPQFAERRTKIASCKSESQTRFPSSHTVHRRDNPRIEGHYSKFKEWLGLLITNFNLNLNTNTKPNPMHAWSRLLITNLNLKHNANTNANPKYSQLLITNFNLKHNTNTNTNCSSISCCCSCVMI